MGSEGDFVYETRACDEAASRMYREIASAIRRGLSALGLEPVFEDSTAVAAIRVVDERNLGTAYLEIRDCGIRMRIVLAPEQPEERVAS
jgi:aspartate aminotransferase-like enzyme